MSTSTTRLAVAGVLTLAVAASAAIALGAAPRPTVRATANAALGKTIVVDARGRTLYRLSGETKTHLKCTSSACLSAWAPLTVASKSTKLVAGTGVHGSLSLLHRSGGKLQVVLGGHPLYRFAGDTAVGKADGEGLKSFGGTWTVISAGTSSGSTPTTGATPAPTIPGY